MGDLVLAPNSAVSSTSSPVELKCSQSEGPPNPRADAPVLAVGVALEAATEVAGGGVLVATVACAASGEIAGASEAAGAWASGGCDVGGSGCCRFPSGGGL